MLTTSGEPHAACATQSINATTWAPEMWKAMLGSSVTDPAVSWDAHWEGSKPNHHDKVRIDTPVHLYMNYFLVKRAISWLLGTGHTQACMPHIVVHTLNPLCQLNT